MAYEIGDLKADKNQLTSDGAQVTLLEVQLNPTEFIRLARNAEAVEFGGYTWQPHGFNIDDLKETTGENERPRSRVTISNVRGEAQRLIRQNRGLKEARVRIIEVNTARLLSINNAKTFTGKVKQVSYDDEQAATLDISLEDFDDVVVPRGQYLPTCRWFQNGWFKEPLTCAYEGSDVSCSGQLNDANGCRAKGNEVNFGGCPGMLGQ